MKTNGYELIKFLHHELDNNTELQRECKPTHISLYTWMIELQNRIGWDINTFGLPTENAMFYSCIGNNKTYNKCIEDLVKWGVIKQISKSVNQYQARKISLKSDKFKAYLTGKVYNQKKERLIDAIEKSAEAENKQGANNIESKGNTIAPTYIQAVIPYKTIKTDKPLNQLKTDKPVKSKSEISSERSEMLWDLFNGKYTLADKSKFTEIISGVYDDKILLEKDKLKLNQLIYKFFYNETKS